MGNMKQFRYNKLLIVVIVIGLVAALTISFQRHAVETANRQVDMAIDYEGLLSLAAREGVPADDVLKQAKDAGFSSLDI